MLLTKYSDLIGALILLLAGCTKDIPPEALGVYPEVSFDQVKLHGHGHYTWPFMLKREFPKQAEESGLHRQHNRKHTAFSCLALSPDAPPMPAHKFLNQNQAQSGAFFT